MHEDRIGERNGMSTSQSETVLNELVRHYDQDVHTKQFPSAPYFDALLGRPPQVPVVIEHWKQTLAENVVPELISGYQDIIRPAVLTKENVTSRNGVAVLIHYEVLISRCTKDVAASRSAPEYRSTVERAIHAICTDITLLTGENSKILGSNEEEADKLIICNLVLPTLLKLVSHGIPYLESNSDILLVIASTALAFLNPRMNPTSVTPFLQEQNIMNSCSYPPTKTHDIVLLTGKYWDSAPQLDSSRWNDPVSGIGKRASLEIWNNIGSLLQVEHEHVKDICTALGVERMAKAVRAHFFGRDMLLQQATTVVVNRTNNLPLGTKSKTVIVDRPFDTIRSRVHSALALVSILDSTLITHQVLDDILPICYALVDASNSTLIALGGASLVLVLRNASPNHVDEFGDGLVSVLELASRTCREGHVLATVCHARTIFFEKATGRQKERRQATYQLFKILQQNTYKEEDTEDGLILGLLVNGIVPLLYQHANEPNADSLEMGRLGLMSLLPLLRWHHNKHDQRIQYSALICLVNLMMGAYPIMPHHGGKVMSELLACIGHAQRRIQKNEDETCLAVLDLAKHVAAVAVVLCGERALDVLNRVEGEEKYEPILVEGCKEIRLEADALLERRDENPPAETTRRVMER